MSLYVVVEGRRTEPKIYRAWLPLLIPGLVPVARIEDATDHHFYIVAGRGYPSYLDRIHDAVGDLRLPDSPFTHLVICADAEESPRAERHEETEDPERIPLHAAHRTRAQLCFRYLRAVFRERKQRYSKDDPGTAVTESYLDALKDRASPPPHGLGHLASFAHLLDLPRRYAREP